MRQAKGFTLIELLVSVAIVAILVSLAVASYGFATVKTRRAAAKTCLTEAAQTMERHYTLNMSYDTALPDPPCSADVTDYYDVGFAAGQPTDTTYKIEAVPTASQDDGACGTLSLDQTGTKGANDVDACW
jgi:type IV pilus assembly protein PilE